MKRLPAPLTPADCDLRDFGFMPLDCVRLRDSDMASTPSAEAFRVAVLLWCASWHQVPAASLPDDDIKLAQLALFGRAVDEFRALKAEAMHGFVLCSDGRLYHRVVAEKAQESWAKKQKQRARTANATAARRGAGGASKPAKPPRQRNDDTSGHRDDDRNDHRDDEQKTHQGTVKGRDSKGTGRRKKVSGANAPSPADAGSEGMLPLELKPSARDNGFAALWLMWPQKGRSNKREAQADWAALLKHHTPAVLKAAVEAYLRSDDATRDMARTVPALERWLKKRAEAWVEIAANPDMEQVNGRAHDVHAHTGRTGSKRGDVVRAAMRIKADDERRRQASGDSHQGETGIPSGAAARLAPPRSSE